MVLGGDLNFILPPHELWGKHDRLDPLASFMIDLICGMGLVDADPRSL